jgi:hypothetical protein
VIRIDFRNGFPICDLRDGGVAAGHADGEQLALGCQGRQIGVRSAGEHSVDVSMVRAEELLLTAGAAQEYRIPKFDSKLWERPELRDNRGVK